MGFFSWDCRSCGHPMICEAAVNENGINRWMTEVVVMFKDGTRFIGKYDGYGRVGDFNITSDVFDSEEPCCYHKACWEKEGKPEYDEPSESSADQSWFFEEQDHAMKEPGK